MPRETLRPATRPVGSGLHPSAMASSAILHCELVNGVNRLTRVRSEGQIVLRPTHPKAYEPWVRGDSVAARVSQSAGTAGPLGGDRLELEVRVGAGATLVLNEISATLALPGTSGDRSVLRSRVTVEAGATLIWMPEPVIAAQDCDHQQLIFVDLAPDARLYLREELIVGRHSEAPGNIEQRLRITREGAAIYDQSLRLGPRYTGWNSPAVHDRAKAVGTMTIVDPGSTIGANRRDLIGTAAVSVGLADDVIQATALASNSLELSRLLDDALARVAAPWAPGEN